MACEVKYNGPSPEQRLAARLKNSGEGTNPSVHVVQGEGTRRVHVNIHHGASQGGAGNRLGRDSDGSAGGGNG
jgi:hypothetical protein